ncbi:MAG: hypothetical protein HQ472_07030 [Ignavibacteria bacterium]|nr:hypothetical protein [Ignavibacteria bacterium]
MTLTRVFCLAVFFVASLVLPDLPASAQESTQQSIQQSANSADGRIIRRVIFDQRDVFDEKQDDWFFAGPLANALHTTTRPYILEDELLLDEGDEVDSIAVLEMERNLRRSGLFSKVVVSVQNVGADSADLVVYTQDRWSLRPAILFGTGGGISNIGGKLEEINLMGTATQALVYGLYRTENDIGWEGFARVIQRRLFRSELNGTISIKANQFRTDQRLSIVKPYRTMSIPWAFGVTLSNAFGRDFQYLTQQPTLLPFHERTVSSWISKASGEVDRLFVSAGLGINSVNRSNVSSRQAFDNTGQFLISFSSLRQKYSRTTFLNGFETEDVMEGAWGNATMGRIFSLGNGGQTMWYISGTAQQSGYVSEKAYLYGSVNGATGFGDRTAKYTHLELNGIGHYRASGNFLIAARLRSQTSWNWNAYRQLVADFESGLRGYNANGLSGDNRVIGNAELRWFPDWRVWIFGISSVAFYDVGTVWNQGLNLGQARFHHSVGLGLRLHNLKAAGDDATFRFDFAYNLDDHKIAGVIFSTSQLFSAFGTHKYLPPDVSGREIDVQ